MGADEKLGAAMHGATPLEQIKARSDAALIHESLTSSNYSEMAWESARDVPRLIAALEAVMDIKDQNFFDSEVDAGYSYGWNAALEEINAAIASNLGES